ncbi:hypothetical protein PVK06_047056 [Gossypium arboreum]|uniref:Uncharacterized protein n=1 Tax=Gossypium arboreum TaxID=29729 RepID=A0ABR0MEW0_GOSAR|nr:hypothetical protein PVK06_047056 [Gossypium arboreum]
MTQSFKSLRANYCRWHNVTWQSRSISTSTRITNPEFENLLADQETLAKNMGGANSLCQQEQLEFQAALWTKKKQGQGRESMR